MKKLLLLIACVAFTAMVYPAVNIYFFNGKVDIVDKGKASSVTQVNELVPEGASVKLAENSEAILRNSEDQFAILKKAGEYTASKIKDEFAAQKGKDLVESMASFLGTELTTKHVDIRKMSENYMRQKGGVTRQGSVYPLMMWPPYGSVSETNKVKFVWNSMPGVKRYEFVVYGGEDPNNTVQLSKSLETDTSMDVNFSDFGLEKDAYFSWVAYPEGDQNYSRYTFKISTPDNVKKMLSEVDQTAGKESKKDDQLLIKALAFEKKGLIDHADKCYKDLLKLSNKNVYKELYTLFQVRNNLAAK